MAEEAGEKTEAPTDKRKRKAAEDGELLKSKDFATALCVLAGCGWMMLFGPSLLDACKAIMTACFSFGPADVADFDPLRPLAASAWKLAPAMLSLFAIVVAAAIASQAGLGSLRFNGGLLAPKASRVNPASGLKRIFGPQGWIELGKSLLKVVLLGSIGAWLLWRISKPSIGLVETDVPQAVETLGGQFMTVVFVMAGGLAAIALLDVPIQLVRLLGRLRMTKQEVKDEHKESEGSPEVKGALRRRQHEMAKRSVRKAVAGAQVVLTNPTHFAVALRYARETDQVPVVVAKGRGAVALAIREVAGEAKVPILEYPQLARALYYTTRENQEIRDDLYQAIAVVLAFVFGLNRQAGGRQPDISVPDTARFDENGRRQG